MSSHLSSLALVARHLRAGLAGALGLALIVLVAAAATSVAPRALEQVLSADVRAELAPLSDVQRDLRAFATGTPLPVGPGEVPEGSTLPSEYAEFYGNAEEQLEALRQTLPTAAQAITEPADYVERTSIASDERIAVARRDGGGDTTQFSIAYARDPRIAQRIELVDGRMPESTTNAGALPTEDTEIMLSVEAAEDMQWELGEVRDQQFGLPAVLVGTFAPQDPDDRYWSHLPVSREAAVLTNGDQPTEVWATAYVNPEQAIFESVTSTIWFPVEVGELTATDAREIGSALRAFTVQPQVLQQATVAATVTFTSELADAVDRSVRSADVLSTVLAVAVSTVLALLAVVMVASSALIVARRRAATALAIARGSGPGVARGLLALEGLLIGVPAGVVGALAAAALVPATVAAGWLAVPIAIALLPAALLAAWPLGVRGVGTSALRRVLPLARLRLLAEALLAALAALALALLLGRPAPEAGSPPSSDPLALATPLLVTLAAGALALRLYPALLAGIARLLHPRRGLIAYLGATRAARSPLAGLATVLAVVVGASVAVSALTLSATVTGGIDAAARERVGADARIDDAEPGTAAAVAALPGVAAVVELSDAGLAGITSESSTTTSRAQLVLADLETLAVMRPDLVPPAAAAQLASADGPAALATPEVLDSAPAPITVAGIPVDLVGEVSSGANPLGAGRWVLVDREAFLAAANAAGDDRDIDAAALLVDADARLALPDSARLIEAAGPDATITLAADAAAATAARPAVTGFEAALAAVIAAAAVLTVTAVGLSVVQTRAARAHTLATLRTLGVERRRARALIAWEFVSPIVVATLLGAPLGVAVALLVGRLVPLGLLMGGA